MKGCRSKESGTQLAEFALALPVIIFLALIAVEGANLFRVYLLVANASREGARVAILPWYSPAAMNQQNQVSCSFTNKALTSANAVCQDVANYAQNNKLIGNGLQQCSTLSVNVNQSYQAPTDSAPRFSQITVTCTYKLNWLPRLPSYAVANAVNITRTTAFLNLY